MKHSLLNSTMDIATEAQIYLAALEQRKQHLSDSVIVFFAAFCQLAEAEADLQGHHDLETHLRYQQVFHDHFTQAYQNALRELGQIDD